MCHIHAIHPIIQITRWIGESHVARFDTGEFQYIIDEFQKQFAIGIDRVDEVGFLFIGQVVFADK